MAEEFQSGYSSLALAGVPDEWQKVNPDVPPSVLAKAWLNWQSQQPDAVGRFRQRMIESAQTGPGTANENPIAGGMFEKAGSVLSHGLPESYGGAARDALLALVPGPAAGASVGTRIATPLLKAAAAGLAGTGVDTAMATSQAGPEAGYEKLKEAAGRHGLAAASAGVFGLGAEGVTGVTRGILQKGVNEGDAFALTRAMQPWFTVNPATVAAKGYSKGLYDAVVGGDARQQQRSVLDTLENAVKQDLGGGNTFISVPAPPRLMAMASQMASPKGLIKPVQVPLPNGGSTYIIKVDEAFDVMRALKSMKIKANESKNPLIDVKGQDAGRLSDMIEQGLQNKLSPSGQQYYEGFKDFFKESEPILKFLEDASRTKGLFTPTPRGPEFNMTVLQEMLQTAKSGRKSGPILQKFSADEFKSLVDAISRGAGSGAGDVRHGPLSFLMGMGAPSGRFRVPGIPGTTIRELAGGQKRVPVFGSNRISQTAGAQFPEMLKGISEVME